jgi:hypothetical protein
MRKNSQDQSTVCVQKSPWLPIFSQHLVCQFRLAYNRPLVFSHIVVPPATLYGSDTCYKTQYGFVEGEVRRMAGWALCFPLCLSFLYRTLYSKSCCAVICTSIQQRGRRQFPTPPHMPLQCTVYISISATWGCSWCCRVTRHQIRDNAAADGWILLREWRGEEAMAKAVIKQLKDGNSWEDRMVFNLCCLMLHLRHIRIRRLTSLRNRIRLFTVMWIQVWLLADPDPHQSDPNLRDWPSDPPQPKMSLHGSNVSLLGSTVSLHGSTVSLHGSKPPMLAYNTQGEPPRKCCRFASR